ncbi:MAG TPA: hypothetical protein VJV76_03230 [Gaiellaceae bacterium]|nr:hypothetical protein [Gaiellaceae bacterium]
MPGQGRLFAPGIGIVPRAFAAVIVSLLVALGLGQLPRSHPLIPALHFRLPALPSPAKDSTISLPARLALGSTLTLHGRLSAAGTVTVEGAYGHGPWHVLASVPVANGSYEAQLPLHRKGVLHVRVIYPDGQRAVGETDVG